MFEAWTSEPTLDLRSGVVKLRRGFTYRWQVFSVIGTRGMRTPSLERQTPIGGGSFALGR